MKWHDIARYKHAAVTVSDGMVGNFYLYNLTSVVFIGINLLEPFVQTNVYKSIFQVGKLGGDPCA